MARELPIACSLSADELPARLAQMAAIGRDALLDAERSGDRARLRFADAPGTRARLEAIVAAESDCCTFLTMQLAETAGEITLSIEGPAGAEPVIEELVQAFAA